MNIDNNDKLCWHLVEMEKLSPPLGPPPLQSSISIASLEDNQNLGNNNNVCSKGQMDVDSSMNGETIHCSLLALIGSPPLMHPRGSIYSTPNRNWRVASRCSQGIWKAKSQVIQNSMS